MLIRYRPAHPITASDITPESVYLNRRGLLACGAAAALGLMLPGETRADPAGLGPVGKSPFSTSEDMTGYDAVTSYNNFYEFGLDKEDPSRNAHRMQTRPWTVRVEGEVMKPRDFDIETLLTGFPLEERIYRLRCVEAWSMVVPWIGFPLSALLKQVEPKASARYVAFETLHDPRQMPGQRRAVLQWPYREGLRLDEAMHDLTILSVGLYGKVLPNQNGAPVRLVVPWKYGFKSIKSITRIRLTEREPTTAWNQSAPGEYGFYANVNPHVDHPRWSQARERRIGDFFRRPTLMFNGYEEQVADLYSGMNLKKYY